MLHLEDLSVLETVMRNAVVFTRMCSHQKGQVMDLLGGRGLHQVLNGQQRKIPVSYTSTLLLLQCAYRCAAMSESRYTVPLQQGKSCSKS